MTASGTTLFNLSNMDVVLEAFDRIQLRPAELTRGQLVSAYRSLNLAMATWANRGVNLWEVEPLSPPISFVAGTATYTLPSSTVQLLDVYVRYTSNGNYTDRILYPISRTDYTAIPNKQTQGIPSSFWFNRQEVDPTITLWPTPGSTTGYTLNMYMTKRVQDANALGSETLDVPVRFLEAAVADLAARLAQKFKPQLWPALQADAARQWGEAAVEDAEKVPFYIAPEMGGYFR